MVWQNYRRFWWHATRCPIIKGNQANPAHSRKSAQYHGGTKVANLMIDATACRLFGYYAQNNEGQKYDALVCLYVCDMYVLCKWCLI